MASTARDFQLEWRPLAERLEIFLTHRGLAPHDRDDIVQEAGLRLFSMWDAVEPHGDLWPLAVTIALNIIRDDARRPKPGPLDASIELDIRDDVERAGIARVELQEVQKLLGKLKPNYRTALLAELNGDPVQRAHKMVRLRARRALRRLLDNGRVGWAAVLGKGRRVADMMESIAGAALQPAQQGAASAVGALAAVGLLVVPLSGAEAAAVDSVARPSSALHGDGQLVTVEQELLEIKSADSAADTAMGSRRDVQGRGGRDRSRTRRAGGSAAPRNDLGLEEVGKKLPDVTEPPGIPEPPPPPPVKPPSLPLPPVPPAPAVPAPPGAVVAEASGGAGLGDVV